MNRRCQSESQKRGGNCFNLWTRSHDKRTWVCIGSFIPEDISVSQCSEWIQLKTLLFEFPARISMENPYQMLQHHLTNTQGAKKRPLIVYFVFISVSVALWETNMCEIRTNPPRKTWKYPIKEWFGVELVWIQSALQLDNGDCMAYCMDMHAVCYPLSLSV